MREVHNDLLGSPIPETEELIGRSSSLAHWHTPVNEGIWVEAVSVWLRRESYLHTKTSRENSMLAMARLLGSMTDTRLPRFVAPEEEELERKRQELDHLLSELAESELELATLRSELVASNDATWRGLAVATLSLISWKPKLRSPPRTRRPTDPSARQKAESAHKRARRIGGSIRRRHRKAPRPWFRPNRGTQEVVSPSRQGTSSRFDNRRGRKASPRESDGGA